MKLHLNPELAKDYHSNSQIARVLTENWVKENLYCPICGKPSIDKYENNHPVGDFYCERCNADFELKSKKSISGRLDALIADGEYATMISRITSSMNPNFFFMTYHDFEVHNFVLIPNHFFTPQIVIKRCPLGANARRAGWIRCNIDISGIPDFGKIFIVKNRIEIAHDTVIENYKKTKSLLTSNIDSRGWILDILSCIERIPSKDFTLEQVYSFESELKAKHPKNSFIRDKIRQQLQLLRDKRLIDFVSRGRYRKV